VIALAWWCENVKITTPKEAGTSIGVSPISSIRNVMVKVKDTLSFIEAARAKHGDRYDYSQTEYVGSSKPITIICKVCGPFVLSESHSHTSAKACGCRSCNKEESLLNKGQAKFCTCCGVRIKYRNHHECVDCRNGWPKLLATLESLLGSLVKKQAKLTGWNKWARARQRTLYFRCRRSLSNRNHRVVRCVSWDDWASKVNFDNQSRRQGWDKKCANWVSRIRNREQDQPKENY
jgi:hypothetical protein